MIKRWVLATGLFLMAMTMGVSSFAHHGWRWTADGNFELTGVIVAVRLGNPHGELTVDAEGEEWLVEIGQPFRNERAGLSPDMLAEGVEVIASGHRSANAEDRLMKAERLTIDGQLFDLYPDRD
ncbi:MAG: DUF6152 family protein [Geminicoccaceae bacterium]